MQNKLFEILVINMCLSKLSAPVLKFQTFISTDNSSLCSAFLIPVEHLSVLYFSDQTVYLNYE